MHEICDDTLLQEELGNGIKIINTSDTSEALMISWQGRTFTMFTVTSSIPEDNFYATLKISADKEKLTRIVKEHQAHIVISQLDKLKDMGDAIDSSIWLMALTMAVSKNSKALGVFWSSSQNLVVNEQFNEMAVNALIAKSSHHIDRSRAINNLPLSYWVSPRLFSNEKKVAARTQGMSTFTGYEIEIDSLKWNGEKMLHVIVRIISYLFFNGSVLGNGQSLQLSSTEKFKTTIIKNKSGNNKSLMLKLA